MRGELIGRINPLLIILRVNSPLSHCPKKTSLPARGIGPLQPEAQIKNRIANFLPLFQAHLLSKVYKSVRDRQPDLIRARHRWSERSRQVRFVHAQQRRNHTRRLGIIGSQKSRIRIQLFHRHTRRQRITMNIENVPALRLAQKNLLPLRRRPILLMILHLQDVQPGGKPRKSQP